MRCLVPVTPTPHTTQLWVAVVNAFPFLLSGPGLPGFGRKGWGNIQKRSFCPGDVGMHLKGETFCTNGSH